MAGLGSILELGKRSLSTNQYGINVTSHNISNASTPGYTRQRLNVTPAAAEQTSFGYLGTGVSIQSVQRIRESYIDQQVYTVNQNMGRASQRENVLRLTESFLQEPSESGLNAMMSKFYSAFQDLAVHPEENANRNSVLQRANLLAGTFRRISESITTLQRDVLKEAEAKVEKLNDLIGTIAELDTTIMVASATGAVPNDVMDQRDYQLAELSKLADVRVADGQNGSVTVSLGGTMVLSGGNKVPLTTVMNGDQLEVYAQGSTRQMRIGGGEVNALQTLNNVTFKDYRAQLDELASAFITSVNTIHTTGYGIGNPPPTGNNFFAGTDASSIALDPSVAGNVNNIAASLSGDPGDNEIAIRIANLQNTPVMSGNSNTMVQFYSAFVSNVGSEIQSVSTEAESARLVQEQLTTQQNSVSGVSLDEEMTRLIQYQHGFDAAARVVTTVNDMFQTIIHM
ncbi:MAG: flagellar hook-associated protein FlgK [Bacteroidetes bacterium]|nr:flagellar hook-associated protein FlgK [Bacteroidota bacterium]